MRISEINHSVLMIFCNYIYINLDEPRTKVVAMFVDFKNSFNSVDHKLLFRKLMHEYNLEPWYILSINEN